MAEHKHSRQREVIRQLLQGRTDHPTAEQLYEEAKQVYPGISMGTVYRNLAFLTEHREPRKISRPQGADRYDPRLAPHHHFVCTSCGELRDIEVSAWEGLAAIEDLYSFGGDRITGYEVTFYGLCRNCLEGRIKEETDCQDEIADTALKK